MDLPAKERKIGALFVDLVHINRNEIENGMGKPCLMCEHLGVCVLTGFQCCVERDSSDE